MKVERARTAAARIVLEIMMIDWLGVCEGEEVEKESDED